MEDETFALGRWRVWRAGDGAMQLSGDGVFGPPRGREEALGVLRAAVAAGVDHIDTAQFYGAGTVNQLIREALHPYPDGLAIVSKVGGDPRRGIEENPATLDAGRLAAVNLRINLADQRSRDVLAECVARGIAFVPFCPLGTPGQVHARLFADPVLAQLGKEMGATPTQVQLAWLLDLAPNILLIPGTRTRAHLAEDLAAVNFALDDAARVALATRFPAGGTP